MPHQIHDEMAESAWALLEETMEGTLFRTSEWMLLLATLVCLLAAVVAWVIYDKEMLAIALWFTGSGTMVVAVLLAPPDPDERGWDRSTCDPRRQAPD